MHDDDMTQRPHEERMNAEWPVLALFVAVLACPQPSLRQPLLPTSAATRACRRRGTHERSACRALPARSRTRSMRVSNAIRNASTRAGSNWGVPRPHRGGRRSLRVPGRAEGGEGPVSERVPARVEEAADLHRPSADRGLPVVAGASSGISGGRCAAAVRRSVSARTRASRAGRRAASPRARRTRRPRCGQTWRAARPRTR